MPLALIRIQHHAFIGIRFRGIEAAEVVFFQSIFSM